MRKAFVVCSFVAAIALGDELADSRRLAREASAAYKAKDYATLLEKSRAASSLRPAHSGLLYNLACALALNGETEAALDVLERVAAMGVIVNPAADENLAALRTSTRFPRIVETFARNASPKGTTARAFTIDERGIISEGIARDPKTGRFFVSSARSGVIYARDRRGRITKFAHDPDHGIFGMAVDANRRRLWAAASALPQGPAAVLEIDLDDGKVLHSFAAADAKKHVFGDLTLAKDGRVFVSDSITPSIYVVTRGGLEPFIDDGPFGSLQGLAAGNVLYVSDYAKGIFAVDLATRDVRLLAAPPEVTLLGVDGLYAVGQRTLIATQNGFTPQRVIRIGLAPGGLAVESVEVLASNEPDFDDITLGIPVGHDFYFNAASQWALFGDGAEKPDAAKLKPALVLRVGFQE
jgi:hypothetical protein